MTIDLLVLRHAATAWNEDGRLQGRADLPLSPAGQLAAASWRLPDRFAGAAVLASPLRRATETAVQFGAPRIEPRLVEMAWGRWEGRRLRDLRAADPGGVARMEAAGLDFRPPGGESPRDVMERLRSLFADLAHQERAVLVTHKGVLHALLALSTDWAFAGPAPLKVRDGVAWRVRTRDGVARGVPEVMPLVAGRAACGR